MQPTRKHITIRIDPKVLDRLRDIAFVEETSVSALVRRAVGTFVATDREAARLADPRRAS